MYTLIVSLIHKPSQHVIKLFLLILTLVLFTTGALSQAPNISYQTPQAYTAYNSISPLAPINTGGTVPVEVYGQVTTFSGNGIGNSVGTAATASYAFPTGVACDNIGNTFLADYENNVIKEISSAGIVTVLAGSGVQSALNGTGIAATFALPVSLAADGGGNIYVADFSNSLIRKISSTGVVTTLAGSTSGFLDGIGTSAKFSSPTGVAVDKAGNVFVADRSNNVIRKITPTGVVTTFAGSGSAGALNGPGATASFRSPGNLAFDDSGNLYVTDYNHLIRKITPAGVVTTLAGNGSIGSIDGTGTAASFNYPLGIVADHLGNVYVADAGNYLIRKITPAGVVTTIAGNGSKGFINNIGTLASFSSLYSLAIDVDGNIYAADAFNNSAIRKIQLSGYTIDKPLPAGLTFDQTTGIISGTPTVSSPATNYTITAYNKYGSSSTVISLQVTAIKPSIITFPELTNAMIDANNNILPNASSTNTETPIMYTSSNTAVATITADGLIHLVGPGVTTITATQNGNTNYTAATPVTVTLTVTESQEITFPAIAVKNTCDADFSVGATSSNNIIPIAYSSSNTAVATISTQGIIHILGAGTTTITANQSGNNLYTPANPQSQILTVNAPVVPLVTINPDLTLVCVGTPVNFVATVSNVNAGLAYQWQVNGVNVGSNSATLTYTPLASTDVFQCFVTNTVSCNAVGASNSYSGIIVNQYITPVVTLSSSATVPVCSGTPITFTAAPITSRTTQASFNWQVNGVSAGTNSAVFTNTNFADGDVVTCTATFSSDACLTTSILTSNAIKVAIITPANPGPSVSITASENNMYADTKITFTATPLNAGTITSYQWQVNGLNKGSNNQIYSSTTLKNGDIITCVIVSSTICSAPATSNSLVQTVLPPPTVKIPNTFTPNGDGINDSWSITDLNYYTNCLVTVYNRNGKMVYQSKGYNKAWDGSFNGQTLPVSTYYYVIDLGNQSAKLSGYLTLIR